MADDFFRAPAPSDPSAWPYDQRYWGKCRSCGADFMGPKRAPGCWQCVSETLRDQWTSDHSTREQS